MLCVPNIVVVGKKENIQRIVDSLQEMQGVMKEIAGQIRSEERRVGKECRGGGWPGD